MIIVKMLRDGRIDKIKIIPIPHGRFQDVKNFISKICSKIHFPMLNQKKKKKKKVVKKIKKIKPKINLNQVRNLTLLLVKNLIKSRTMI